MPTFIKILSSQEIKRFENPPIFDRDQRKQMFKMQSWVKNALESLDTPINKIGFMLQLGYFRAATRFFSSHKYHLRDIEYVAKHLKVKVSDMHFDQYKRTTFRRHQQIIVDTLGYQKYTGNVQELLINEAMYLTSLHQKPKIIFWSLVDLLNTRKIQVPSYNALSIVITETIKNFELILVDQINTSLSEAEKAALDSLLIKENEESVTSSYLLTSLKSHNHSLKANKIKENLEDHEFLEGIFRVIYPVVLKINLTTRVLKYYADVVIRSQTFQISRREDNRYLYLIAFIVNNYFELNDMLVLKLNKSVQQSKNAGAKDEKEMLFENRVTKTELMRKAKNGIHKKIVTIDTIWDVVNNPEIDPTLKIEEVIKVLQEDKKDTEKHLDEDLALIDHEIERATNNADYFDTLEARSKKLQNKVAGIIKKLTFDELSSQPVLIDAINYFKNKDGKIEKNAPLSFLEDKELKVLFDSIGKIRVSLYKILLFIKVSHGIKSGALNLLYSYDYKAFEEYLIDGNVWSNKKTEILKRAGLSSFSNWVNIETNLKGILEDRYRNTNQHIADKQNQYIKIGNDKLISLSRYKAAENTNDDLIDLFPQDKYISIYEVLLTVNNLTNYLDSFESLGIKHLREVKDDKTIFAGIIGYGCNIGIHKLANLSRNISAHKLMNTIKTRFTLENIQAANNKVLELIGDFELSNLFKKDIKKTHTASDGQKYLSTVDSVYANKSFKYFGMNDGLVVNSYIDDSYRLFYSTVISPAEREAAYTIDGLLHNEVVQSDIHSTDTHGYNEIIFGVTHLLGISFAPRISDFKKQYLYSFDYVASVKGLGYMVVPNRKINTKLIHDNWDDILRLIATMKAREVTASQLFKRLSSYSREHPLYRALKEFGKIIKTIFLLQYIDDVELRKQIQKMLNKIEGSNKLAKAVFHGRDKEFKYAGKNEQLIADACKRLIENSIICWNYAYLTQLVSETDSAENKQLLIETIKSKSVVAWEHVNMKGIYDFSEASISKDYEFSKDALLNAEIV